MTITSTSFTANCFGGVTKLVADEYLATSTANLGVVPESIAQQETTSALVLAQHDVPEASACITLSRPVSATIFTSGVVQNPAPANTAVIQMEVTPGQPFINAKRIVAEMERLAAQGIKLMMAGELCISGYMLGDLWFQNYFLDECENARETVRAASERLGITIVFGAPVSDPTAKNETGYRRLYNAAIVITNGEYIDNGVMSGMVFKTNLPNYGPFDDKRYFHDFYKLAWELGIDPKELYKPFSVTIDGEAYYLCPVICEDSWDEDYTHKVTQYYIANAQAMGIPEDRLLLINVSCSPWRRGKIELVHDVMRKSRHGHNVPLVFAHQVGYQNIGKTDFAMYGASFVLGSDGALLASAKFLVEDTLQFNLKDLLTRGAEIQGFKDDNLEAVYETLLVLIREVWKGRDAIIGLSGGIDSAVVAALFVDALGADHVIGLSMPMPYNEEETKDDGFILAQNLGIRFGVMPMERLFNTNVDALSDIDIVQLDHQNPLTPKDLYAPAFARMRAREKGEDTTVVAGHYKDQSVTRLTISSTDEENIQARLRGSGGLLGAAAPLGARVTNNGNDVETTVGYATYHGDILGAASIISNLPKEDVWDLARLVNKKHGRAIIPQSIIDRIPSAELKANQKDPFIFPYHDWVFANWKDFDRHAYDILKMCDDNRWYDDLPWQPFHIDKASGEKILFATPQEFVHYYWSSIADFVKDLRKYYAASYAAYFKREQGPRTFGVGRRNWGFDKRESHIEPLFGPLYDALEAKVLSAGK